MEEFHFWGEEDIAQAMNEGGREWLEVRGVYVNSSLVDKGALVKTRPLRS